jgi:paraquat-inducible protein B
MNDTPQTDNLARGNHVVPTEFAQELEMERNHAKEGLVRAGILIAQMQKNADEFEAEVVRLREALDTLTLVVGLTPIAGNKEALQEAMDQARKALATVRGETTKEEAK